MTRILITGLVGCALSWALGRFLLPVLQEYRRIYPGIRIKITNQSSAQAMADVKNGITDF